MQHYRIIKTDKNANLNLVLQTLRQPISVMFFSFSFSLSHKNVESGSRNEIRARDKCRADYLSHPSRHKAASPIHNVSGFVEFYIKSQLS